MAYGYKCEGCGEFIELPDGNAQPPDVFIRTRDVETHDDGSADLVVRDSTKITLCDDCRSTAYQDAINAIT